MSISSTKYSFYPFYYLYEILVIIIITVYNVWYTLPANRLHNISSHLDKQYDLLRLIVQKMEIHTEADEQDEGAMEECVPGTKIQ